ncbi:hypothetical protein M2323_004240 [Rhodoblastus acidophilus]|nr:hypothetical protein [Rhodoblastus acidophilus]MCW2335294.1 hypothetical protein [Rhodoblastus acidophilus]
MRKTQTLRRKKEKRESECFRATGQAGLWFASYQTLDLRGMGCFAPVSSWMAKR